MNSCWVLIGHITSHNETEAETVLLERGDARGTIRLVLDNDDIVELDAVELAAAIASLGNDRD
jgi:hypothetical protein